LRKLAQLTQVPEEMIDLRGQLPSNILFKKSVAVGQPEVDPDRVLEVDLLRWLLLVGESLPALKTVAFANLGPESFQNPVCRTVFELLQKNSGVATDLLSLALQLEEGTGESFLNEISEKKINRDRAEAQVLATVQRILERNWMIRRERIKNQIQSGHLSEEAVMELVKQFDAIKSAPPKVKTQSN